MFDNPFPGVDPYLEAQGYWRDFHTRLLTYLSDAIIERLPAGYEARLDERVTLASFDATDSAAVSREPVYFPDVAVARRAFAARTALLETPGASIATLEPIEIPAFTHEEVVERSLKIVSRPDRKVVAVLELLSPSNKNGDGFLEFEGRRDALMKSDSHLVELDLLVGGRRARLAKPLPPGNCFAIVARVEKRPICDVYAWSIRDPLPILPLPLRAPDADIPLDLAAIYAEAYKRGRYAKSIDRRQPLNLPLSAEDVAWAEKIDGETVKNESA